MQFTHTGNKLHLYGYKIILLSAALTIVGIIECSSQRRGIFHEDATENLLDYDDQWIQYGFLMSLHNSRYRIEYDDIFTTPQMDSLHSIVPGHLSGFKLGFVINIFLFQYLDLRLLPTVGFYEFDLTYRRTNNVPLRELKDATMMELPLLLKYKSVRRGNLAMYLVGGINPAFEAAGKGDRAVKRDKLELKNFNLAFDVGAGLDIYYPLFKFSPEVRYSFGLTNLLNDDRNDFTVNLSRLVTHNIAFFITFEGGPNYLKRRRKRNTP